MFYQKELKFLLVGLFAFCGSPALAQQNMPSFADLVERLTPSVVNISTIHQPDEETVSETASSLILPAGGISGDTVTLRVYGYV